MADGKQSQDCDNDPRRVMLSEEEALFIKKQLMTAMELGQDGKRLGTHLLKRMRKSKAILNRVLVEAEEQQNETPVPPTASGFFAKIKGLLPW